MYLALVDAGLELLEEETGDTEETGDQTTVKERTMTRLDAGKVDEGYMNGMYELFGRKDIVGRIRTRRMRDEDVDVGGGRRCW
jgi:hypothetical protein